MLCGRVAYRHVEIIEMRIWRKIVPLLFPGTYEESLAANKIYRAEVRVYRKRIPFVFGMCLIALPTYYLVLTCEDWVTGGLVASMAIGSILVFDTVCGHYCLLLHRLGYLKTTEVEPIPAPPPKFHIGKVMLLSCGVGILGAAVSVVASRFIKFAPHRGSSLAVLPLILLPVLLNWLVRTGRGSWLVRDEKSHSLEDATN